MVKKGLKLTITEAAYFAVLDRVAQTSLIDPLPLLSYNNEIKRYEVSAYKPISTEGVKNVDTEKAYPLMHQVGRINMCIESPELAEQIYEKKLDYHNGHFIII